MKIKKGTMTAERQALPQTPFPIRTLLARPDGSLWIGFGGMGLGCLKEGRFKHFQVEQGIYDDYISHILVDGRGRFWLAGNRGIFSLREKDLNDLNAGRIDRVQSVVYKQKDGLPGLQASYDAFPGSFCDKDGRLLFAMQSGVAIVYPEAYQEDVVALKVIVDRVLANGNPVVRDGEVIERAPFRRQPGDSLSA
jgi:ligand-binding sensor domain-containing protein